jgi:rod shape-determining protein MreD
MGYFPATTSPPLPIVRRPRDWARAGSRGSDRYMTMLVAAIAATVAAIVESTITSYLRVGSAEPHLLFVLGVVWTVAVGADSGLVWAFIGGLALDTLTQRPLGTTAFALLVAVGLTAAIVRPLNRLRPIAAIVITALLSLVYSMTVVVLLSMLRPPSVLTDSVRLVAPGVVYDVVIAAILGPLAVSVHDRVQRDEERAPR